MQDCETEKTAPSVLFLCFLLFLCVSKMLVLSVADVLGNRIQHVDGRGVVAKGLAHVDEEIFIPGRKHKAAA